MAYQQTARETLWRSPNRFLEADKVLKDRMFAVPETIDELVQALENPHIPEAERIDKGDDDTIYFKDEKKTMDVLSLKLGVVPEWLQQRYKSKFAKVKESTEQKELRKKASAEEATTNKRKADTEAREALEKVVKDMPPPEASLQDRRAWKLELMQGATSLSSGPEQQLLEQQRQLVFQKLFCLQRTFWEELSSQHFQKVS
jgi:hypothetical protein